MGGTRDSATEASSAPFRHVVQGNATAEEVAALVAVFASLQTPTTPTRARPSRWSDPTRTLRRSIPHGVRAWHASTRPR